MGILWSNGCISLVSALLLLLYQWQTGWTGEYRDCMFVHDTYPTLLDLGDALFIWIPIYGAMIVMDWIGFNVCIYKN
jgi:hypothetical protein